MIHIYPACFYKENDGYSVIFPDFPGGTCGDSLDDAMRMAVDFLACNLSILEEENKPFPDPTPENEVVINSDFEYEEAFVLKIAVDYEEYAQKYFGDDTKVVLTIPQELNVKAFDAELDLSAVLREALEQKLNTQS